MKSIVQYLDENLNKTECDNLFNLVAENHLDFKMISLKYVITFKCQKLLKDLAYYVICESISFTPFAPVAQLVSSDCLMCSRS